MDKKKTKVAHESKCHECGEVFGKKRYWQRFCSEKCRDKWHSAFRDEVADRIRLEREKDEGDGT